MLSQAEQLDRQKVSRLHQQDQNHGIEDHSSEFLNEEISEFNRAIQTTLEDRFGVAQTSFYPPGSVRPLDVDAVNAIELIEFRDRRRQEKMRQEHAFKAFLHQWQTFSTQGSLKVINALNDIVSNITAEDGDIQAFKKYLTANPQYQPGHAEFIISSEVALYIFENYTKLKEDVIHAYLENPDDFMKIANEGFLNPLESFILKDLRRGVDRVLGTSLDTSVDNGPLSGTVGPISRISGPISRAEGPVSLAPSSLAPMSSEVGVIAARIRKNSIDFNPITLFELTRTDEGMKALALAFGTRRVKDSPYATEMNILLEHGQQLKPAQRMLVLKKQLIPEVMDDLATLKKYQLKPGSLNLYLKVIAKQGWKLSSDVQKNLFDVLVKSKENVDLKDVFSHLLNELYDLTIEQKAKILSGEVDPKVIELLILNIDNPYLNQNLVNVILSHKPEQINEGKHKFYRGNRYGAGGLAQSYEGLYWNQQTNELEPVAIKEMFSGLPLDALELEINGNTLIHKFAQTGELNMKNIMGVKALGKIKDTPVIIMERITTERDGKRTHVTLYDLAANPEYRSTAQEVFGLVIDHAMALSALGEVKLIDTDPKPDNMALAVSTGKKIDHGCITTEEELRNSYLENMQGGRFPSEISYYKLDSNGNRMEDLKTGYLYIGHYPPKLGITAPFWSSEIYLKIKNDLNYPVWKLSAYALGAEIWSIATGMHRIRVVEQPKQVEFQKAIWVTGNPGEFVEMLDDAFDNRHLGLTSEQQVKLKHLAQRLMDINDIMTTLPQAINEIREILEITNQ